MKQFPLVSVCIMTYNHAAFIRQAIESVLVQKVNFPWEFIIADDCSTDGAREIILQYKKAHPDIIQLILQEENIGAALNWKDLITRPKSKYIAYFEGDDYWCDENKLQQQVDFLEVNPDYVICFHRVYEIIKNKLELSTLNTYEDERTFIAADLGNGNFLHTPSVVFRRSALPSDFPSASFLQLPVGDYPMYMLLTNNNGLIKYFPKPMAVYRRHDGGVWSNIKSLPRSRKWLCVLDYLLEQDFNTDVRNLLLKQKSKYREKYLQALMKEPDWALFLRMLSLYSAEDTVIAQKWLTEYYPKYINSIKKSKSYQFSEFIKSCIHRFKRR